MAISIEERFLNKEDWAKESEGLPVLPDSGSLGDTVIAIEAVDPEYFLDDSVQHCILERPDKTRYVAPY